MVILSKHASSSQSKGIYVSSLYGVSKSVYLLFSSVFFPSISSFLKVSRVNHKRQTLNSAQDKTHNVISPLTRFLKFSYLQGKQLPCGLVSCASSTLADKVLAYMVRRFLAQHLLHSSVLKTLQRPFLPSTFMLAQGLVYSTSVTVFCQLRFFVFPLSK